MDTSSQTRSMTTIASVLGWLRPSPQEQATEAPPKLFSEAAVKERSQAEPVDRDGQPLPWRWERSVARQLFGGTGIAIALAGSLIAIAAIVGTALAPPAPEPPPPPPPPPVQKEIPAQTTPPAMPKAPAYPASPEAKPATPDPRQQQAPPAAAK